MNTLAGPATHTPTPAAPTVPWTDRWQRPKLADPKPVLAAGHDGSFGFGQQLVLTSRIGLRGASARDAFATAAAPGTPMAVLAQPNRASTDYTVGQFERGHVGATGSPDVDWYRADAIQPDLDDLVGAYRDLTRVHFAPNVRGLVAGGAAWLPVISHGTIGAASTADAVRGMAYVGGDLYLGQGVAASSLDQALLSAKALSSSSGQAFAVTRATSSGTAPQYRVAAVHELHTSLVPSRRPEPQWRHELGAFQLAPGSDAFRAAIDGSVLAVVQGSITAAPAMRHAAVGAIDLS